MGDTGGVRTGGIKFLKRGEDRIPAISSWLITSDESSSRGNLGKAPGAAYTRIAS